MLILNMFLILIRRELIHTKGLMSNLILPVMDVNLKRKTCEKRKCRKEERDKRMRDEYHEQDRNCGENVSDGKEFGQLVSVVDQVKMDDDQHDIESHADTGHVNGVEVSDTQ